MSMEALTNKYAIQIGWAPVAVTSTKTSAAMDMANLNNNLIVVNPGLWTDGTSYTYKLTECATSNGSYTDVAAANQVGTFSVVSSTATSTTPQKVSYIGALRFVQVVCTVVGATTGAVSGVHLIGKPRTQNSST